MKTIILFIIFILLLLFIPIGPEKITYKSVVEKGNNISANIISSTNLKVVENKDYVIYNNELYLRIQTTQSALLLISYINNYRWNIQKLSEFRRQYPQLETYWPATAKVNGGVSWINEH